MADELWVGGAGMPAVVDGEAGEMLSAAQPRADSPKRPWHDGGATGIGSLPGVPPDEAAATIAGEVPELPYIAELPDRGVGADMVGRAIGLLVDIFGEVVPSGWRITRR